MFSIITIASSTTKPVEMVKAISERLSRLYPSRYITPKVPVRHLDDVRARLPLDIEDDRPVVVGPARQLRVLHPIHHLRHVAEPDRGAVAVGQHERSIRGGAEKLVVGCQRVRLPGPI